MLILLCFGSLIPCWPRLCCSPSHVFFSFFFLFPFPLCVNYQAYSCVMARLCPGELTLIECTTRTHIPASKKERERDTEKERGRERAREIRHSISSFFFFFFFFFFKVWKRNSPAEASILIVNMYVLPNTTLPPS